MDTEHEVGVNDRDKPDLPVVCTDIQKLTDVAKSAVDHALEVLKLLPTPIPADSKVYKSLEAIRCVPVESLLKTNHNTEVGIQVDLVPSGLSFQGHEAITEETIACEDYVMINIVPDKHLITENSSETEIIQAQNDFMIMKSPCVMETEENCNEIATIDPNLVETIIKLKYSEGFQVELKKFEDNINLLDECALLLSKVKSEQETDIASDTETLSMKSCKSILNLLKHEKYSKTNDNTSLVSVNPSETIDESAVIPKEPENSKDKNESCVTATEIHPNIKTEPDTAIEETMKHDHVNPKKAPDTMSNEDKTPTNSISNLNTISIKDLIVIPVKPKNYKPQLREDRIFVSEEDIKKCLEIAEEALKENNHAKAKRMTDKAKRIHATMTKQIATEVKEEEESLPNAEHNQLKRKSFDESDTKSKKSAKVEIERTEILKEDLQKAKNINTTNSDTHKVDEALRLIKQARIEMKDKNMKKAEQLLVQSITIYSTASANVLLHDIRKCESGLKHDNSIRDGDSINQARKCIELAEKYRKDKNFKKAEHFLKKSIHIDPNTDATEMLEFVRKSAELESKQQISNEFEKCIELAWNFMEVENLKEAEIFVEKAEAMLPTEKDMKDMLKSVKAGLKDRQYDEYIRRKIAVYEDLLIAYAKTAICERDYEIAEVILTYTRIRYKSIKAMHMLGQVNTVRKHGNKDCSKLKGIAEKYVQLIDVRWQIFTPEEEMAQNLLCVLVPAMNMYPTLRGQELVTKIWDFFQIGDWTNVEWNYEMKTKSMQSFKCNCYVNMANIANKTKNYKIAKELLEEALRLIPAKDIKQLIIQVEKKVSSTQAN